MSVPILICECGLRVKAPGRRRGASAAARIVAARSRCPIGQARDKLQTQEPRRGRRARGLSSGTGQRGFRSRAEPFAAQPGPAVAGDLRRTQKHQSHGRRFLAGPRPARDELVREHPLSAPRCRRPGHDRGHERVFWLFTILMPEYCLTLMGDADFDGSTDHRLLDRLDIELAGRHLALRWRFSTGCNTSAEPWSQARWVRRFHRDPPTGISMASLTASPPG